MTRNLGILSLITAVCLQAGQVASISHPGSIGTVYLAVLNQLKKDGAEIESASKDAGIKTAVTIHGHYRQTGSYLQVTFISDSPAQTTVRVAAYEDKRYKALTTEPWSTPKVNTRKSKAEAVKLKQELGW
ncbi:MAG TPA: hypothetical protein VF283_22440 [Bryobacteraceae bacterium]|nr:hypothetical protein [Candidatus Acidoferrales bacterium]